MSEPKTEHFDGYDVTVDENGVSCITVPENPKSEKDPEPSGFWARLIRWWKTSNVKPTVKIVDMSDPTGKLKKDPFYDGQPKSSVVIGVKVDF